MDSGNGLISAAVLRHWRIQSIPFTGDVLSIYLPIGSHREVLQQITSWLRRPEPPMLLLCGPPGSGKTLTVELVRNLVPPRGDAPGQELPRLVDGHGLEAAAAAGPERIPSIYTARTYGDPTATVRRAVRAGACPLLLRPWTPGEVRAALAQAWERVGGGELPFTSAAADRVVWLSGGVPRAVARLVQGALVVATAERADAVCADHIDRAWHDRHGAWVTIQRLGRAA